jgi:hypothetical protein
VGEGEGGEEVNTVVDNQLKLRKALPERLRSLGLDESWLQKQIAQDTSLLGLGELDLVKREKIQPRGGRIDFLMADPDGARRDIKLKSCSVLRTKAI